jgi:hypothetical protein
MFPITPYLLKTSRLQEGCIDPRLLQSPGATSGLAANNNTPTAAICICIIISKIFVPNRFGIIEA